MGIWVHRLKHEYKKAGSTSKLTLISKWNGLSTRLTIANRQWKTFHSLPMWRWLCKLMTKLWNLFLICCFHFLSCLCSQAGLTQKAQGSADTSFWWHRHVLVPCHYRERAISAGCHFQFACLRKAAVSEETHRTSTALEGKSVAQSFPGLMNLDKAESQVLTFFIWKWGP